MVEGCVKRRICNRPEKSTVLYIKVVALWVTAIRDLHNSLPNSLFFTAPLSFVPGFLLRLPLGRPLPLFLIGTTGSCLMETGRKIDGTADGTSFPAFKLSEVKCSEQRRCSIVGSQIDGFPMADIHLARKSAFGGNLGSRRTSSNQVLQLKMCTFEIPRLNKYVLHTVTTYRPIWRLWRHIYISRH